MNSKQSLALIRDKNANLIRQEGIKMLKLKKKQDIRDAKQ